MTEKDTERPRSLVVGHKRDGRCCYDRQAKRELVETCMQPGVSVARMALQQGTTRIYCAPGLPNIEADARRG